MHKPLSTYRIQFHKDFNFSDFEEIIPYLHALGIETIYASPIFKAIPGSTHGYDGVDPTGINPEIGTEKQLLKISKRLKQLGMHWIQDIVPNHMAFHADNVWLMDVLKNGNHSAYFKYFDIGLPLSNQIEPLMLPFLGDSLEDAISKKELKIILERGELRLESGDSKWPLNLEAYAILFKQALKKQRFFNLIEGWLSKYRYWKQNSITSENTAVLLHHFLNLLKNKELEKAIYQLIDQANNDADLLSKIINVQYYRLCNWQETNKKINYRRFFTVNGLICLNIQDPMVFEWYHKYTIHLVKKGVIDGIRIDHVDGLFDATSYLLKLREAVGDHIYIVAEKILHHNEQMPTNWPIQGNTGYDFLSMVNNLLTNKGAERSFSKVYEQFTGKKIKVENQIAKKKADILFEYMAGELDNLTQLFIILGLANEDEVKKLPKKSLREAIGQFLIYCPVYRYYGNSFPLGSREKKMVDAIFNSIPKNPALKEALKLIRSALLIKPAANNIYAKKASLFYQRCMQFTGPLAAKGVEDTLMYTYNRFIGHDEVGDSPDFFGLTVSDFHNLMKIRQKTWPLSLNGTSTHDTKRGEDVRARLNVLTAMPTTWNNWVKRFEELTGDLQQKIKDFKALHQNDLYLIYQTLIGIWPMPGEKDEHLKQRVANYLEKALREAKKRSNWASPDEDYEEMVKLFAINFLNYVQIKKSPIQFSEEISDFGIINSLAQLILKLTCPGIPDFYQGTELWDLSLVDPDNRKPVDYNLRNEYLKGLQELNLNEIWKERYNGKIKLWLIQIGLAHRKEYRKIYEDGDYLPLKTKGIYADHLFAYARNYKQEWIITIIPLGMAAICNDSSKILDFNWEDTHIEIPQDAPSNWENIFTKIRNAKDVTTNSIFVKPVFKKLPFAILKSCKADRGRGAGLLLPTSSLPSAFGIGDIGPESYAFIDFLVTSKQKYWQILPLNPICKEQCYSPYSSQSSMAGNVLLISPEFLQQDGLLSVADLNEYIATENDKVNYEEVEKTKIDLLATAYLNFTKSKDETLKNDFSIFCEQESAWLNDYVLYLAIKKDQGQKPWDEWPYELKKREVLSLKKIKVTYQSFIKEQRWRQFIFHQQWHKLKAYAIEEGIQFIGDLPFYVAFDSAEVWANQKLFKLDERGKMEFSAGVPPDYFNANGQMWCMPIYNWERHRVQKYKWWHNRMIKNLEFVDLLRLDHFRAFDSFWQIPTNNNTAINGTWEVGPGEELFKLLKEKIKDLPFIAEDLGETSESLTALRKNLDLPGMKVLQFAFDEEMLANPHSVHQFESDNFIVYSGTHDNNTTRGWFNRDLTPLNKKRLANYLGKKINHTNVHQAIAMLAYQSIAKICILPVQDVLGLGGESRLNTPSSTTHNWTWRLKRNQLSTKIKHWLIEQTEMYGRD